MLSKGDSGTAHEIVVRLDKTSTLASAYARCTCGWRSRRYVGKEPASVRDAEAAGARHAKGDGLPND